MNGKESVECTIGLPASTDLASRVASWLAIGEHLFTM